MSKQKIKHFFARPIIALITCGLFIVGLNSLPPVSAGPDIGDGTTGSSSSDDISDSSSYNSISGSSSYNSISGSSSPTSGTGRIYGIGSVSKVYTAAAVMKLAEDRLLDPDQPLVNYLPDFTMADPRHTDITPRMLLNHSSGLMGMTDINAILLGDNSTASHDHFLAMLKNQRLKHDPGELSVYSNDSFTLAEILVEQVSGMSFTEYLEKVFFMPLQLTATFTPQSDFDRARLAPVYWQGRELLAQNVNLIGSGGIYATTEDLARFGSIFTVGGAAILSDQSRAEMASDHHVQAMVPADADTTVRYGLGWDSVNTYPFNTLGLKALSKGGNTGGYYSSNLTVLPEYDLSVAVSSSGMAGYEQLIAQEIILAVLAEEGLLDDDFALTLPEYNLVPGTIPEQIKAYAGLYDFGAMGGMYDLSFDGDYLVLTAVNTAAERTLRFIYNQNDEFISIDGDYIAQGISANQGGSRGVSRLSFSADPQGPVFIIISGYENISGLGQTAVNAPFAQKLEPRPLNAAVRAAWDHRRGKQYFLINDAPASQKYLNQAAFRILTDPSAPGYLALEIAHGKGSPGFSAAITDRHSAAGYQKTPTFSGRDIKDITITRQGGFEVLQVNELCYLEEAALADFSTVLTGTGRIKNTGAAGWFRIDQAAGRQNILIDVPAGGAVFIYDERLTCISSSRELNFRPDVALPDRGYIAFIGPEQTFTVTP